MTIKRTTIEGSGLADKIVAKARKAAIRQGRNLYIFPTYHGLVIRAGVDFAEKYVECQTDGTVELVETVYA